MNEIHDKHRYRSHHRTKNCHSRRYEDEHSRRYKHHYQYSSSSSSRHEDRLDDSNKMNYANQYQQSNSRTCTYYSSSLPVPLMSNKTVNTCTSTAAIPHERESWIRSVKKTKINESTEQKVQYLETMLRMPQQQKSSINSSTFDRTRFANEQRSTMMMTAVAENDDNLNNGNSNDLFFDNNNYAHINTNERIAFDNTWSTTYQQYSNTQLVPIPPPSPPSSSIITGNTMLETNSENQPYSGFLIDNCDEAEELSSLSDTPLPLSSTSEKPFQPSSNNLNKQCDMLLNELNTVDTVKKKISKRQKRLQRKLQRKNNKNSKNTSKETIEFQPMSASSMNDYGEVASDWILEYNLTETDPVSQLTDMIKRVSTTVAGQDKTAQINTILKNIKKQQTELKKLKELIISIVDEEPRQNISNVRIHDDLDINQDLFLTFLNQPTIAGCWLCCSEKKFTETATQCNGIDY